MAELIRAPWTSEQVAALERFQTAGGMHPFTCGADQHSLPPRLTPSHSGWYCPDPECDYRQGWAHAFMADPAAWPRFTARPVAPELERAATARAFQAAEDSALASQRLDFLSGKRHGPTPEEVSAAISRPFPEVQGRCPACGWTTLFLGSGGYVTCSRIGCPEPDAASTLLERDVRQETPAEAGRQDRAYWDAKHADEDAR